MELCDNGHDEVCYEASMCPMCKSDDKIKELEGSVEYKEKDLETANNEIKELGKEVSDLKEHIRLSEVD